jgi:Fe-S-cluster containining protein
VLQARGLITREELLAQREVEEKRLERIFQQKRVGVRMDEAYPDKYAIPPDSLPKIDCASRLHLCRGACCALVFPLSAQDIEEGVMRWEYGQPYMIRHGADDRCVHQDRETLGCTVYEHRPAICRTYDCRQDRRIWEDFDRGIVNPNLLSAGPDGRERFDFPKTMTREGEADDEMESGGVE